ncbi:MAG TPA: hypothetical protein VNL95_06125 [Dehalococcoidia bacterium]|nr:hypothetical protein [Dehalococcoidia bacterium]
MADVGMPPEFERPLPVPEGASPFLNDSSYINFCDSRGRTGGMLRVGFRPLAGAADMTFCLFLEDGSLLFAYRTESETAPRAFSAAGLTLEPVVPLRRFRATFGGYVHHVREPQSLLAPREALSRSPRVRVSLDLSYEAVGPPFLVTGLDPSVALYHYQQPMQVRGHLEWESGACAIEGFGMRDRSWGPRVWDHVPLYRALTCTMGPQLAFMSQVTLKEPPQTFGAIVEGYARIRTATAAGCAWQPTSTPPFHRSVSFHLQTEDGPQIVEGTIVHQVPTRFKTSQGVTIIVVAMCRYRYRQTEAYGLYEYAERGD